MSINVRCPNATCATALSVKDTLAGKAIKCPACGATLQVPEQAADVVAVDGNQAGAAPSAGALLAKVKALGLDNLSLYLFLGGLGALLLLILCVFLPWISVGGEVTVRGAGVEISGNVPTVTRGGFRYPGGQVILLFTIAVLAYCIIAFLAQPKLFQSSLFAAAIWSIQAVVIMLIQMFHISSVAGFGFYLSFLMAMAAAGTLGFVAFQQLMKMKKPAA
jgi:hypothetical protein